MERAVLERSSGYSRESRLPSATTSADHPRTVAMVGTYPPTECGLATFTNNLSLAIATRESHWRVDVVRVLDVAESETRDEVGAQWIARDRGSLARAVRATETADVVILQHEYGLFSGPDGADVLDFVDALTRPLVVVLHSVLSLPTERQRWILERLVGAAALVVVQSRHARERLMRDYGVDSRHVEVIAHGAAQNFDQASDEVGLHPRVLTWGLLGPGKGIEHAIAAVARLDAASPAPHYVVAGATHPKVLAAQGEGYRFSLHSLARRLGVADRVHFDPGYRDWNSLRALVRSADVVLLPYESREQESSGVLVEALASGKPVVATAFPHAVELLSSGAGIVVPHGDIDAMSEALARVLFEPGVASAMRACARREARSLMWPAIGASYRDLISRVVALEERS